MTINRNFGQFLIIIFIKMNFQAEFQRYANEKKKLNTLIINYIEDSDNCKDNFNNLIEFINH